jgi:hypothetical protein
VPWPALSAGVHRCVFVADSSVQAAAGGLGEAAMQEPAETGSRPV